jgi:hypothetical protein
MTQFCWLLGELKRARTQSACNIISDEMTVRLIANLLSPLEYDILWQDLKSKRVNIYLLERIQYVKSHDGTVATN